MGAKIRKQIYIEADQESRLKQLARLTNLSEAEIIRRAIDQRTQSLGSKRRNLAAWQSERTFIQQLIAAGPVAGFGAVSSAFSRQHRRQCLYLVAVTWGGNGRFAADL